jgi:hypothetical protein
MASDAINRRGPLSFCSRHEKYRSTTAVEGNALRPQLAASSHSRRVQRIRPAALLAKSMPTPSTEATLSDHFLRCLYASLSGWGYERVVLRVDPPRPARRRRTGPALTCRAIACASACACRGDVMRTSGFLLSKYSRSAMATRPLSEMPNSAAYRRPRRANSSASRNVIAIGEALRCGITMIPTLALSCGANRWCFWPPSATVRAPGWRGFWAHLPSPEGQTR